MAKKKHISAVISLKDNFSATLRGIKREQKSFQKEVKQTKKAMDSAFKKKMKARLDATQAHKQIQKLRKSTKYLEKKKIVINAVAKTQQAMEKIKKVQSATKALGKAIAKPLIMAKDKASSLISSIGGKLKTLSKGIAIPLAVAGAGIGAAVKDGAQLEQQQISMRHFMGVGNKNKSSSELDNMSAKYLKELRENANATPFETGEVIAAGTRALQISGGDTKKAMEKVKLAEDMAALNPGKTISDAMEALADMEMGEYARLTEFGVKATKEGGDTPDSVQKQLSGMYEGGANKLAGSATGLMSTITGKLKSNMADIGQSMLEPLKPVMNNVIEFINQVTPKMLDFGTKIGEGLGSAISFVSENFPYIKSAIEPVITSVQGAIQAAVPVIGQLITSLSPVFSGLLAVANVVFQGVCKAVQTVAPIVSGLLNALKPVFKNVGSSLESLANIFKTAFDGIMGVVDKAYKFIKPLIDGIGSVVGSVTGVVSNIASSVSSFVGGKRKNATGTRYFSGGMSLVGEHGPELVQMPRGAKVYTNSETKGMMSGNSININFNGMTIREDADIDKIANAIVKKIKEARFGYSSIGGMG